MKTQTLITIALAFICINAKAQETKNDLQVPCDQYIRQTLIGRYVNNNYDGEFNSAYAQFLEQKNGDIQAEISIPCGTKIIPAIYQVICFESDFPTLKLISEGASQCTIGEKAALSPIADELIIFTTIRTPGFDGKYEFTKETPSTPSTPTPVY